jgi:ABC-type nickel/cobalt efflux system permease component RcnA
MHETLHFALWLGFLLGLKHAIEADHVVAVTTIVSEQRSIWRSAIVGALWGVGHTISLLIAGIVVILLRVAIPEYIATWLEFAVALMIIGLGTRILYLVLINKQHVHVHKHTHHGRSHTHLHFHEDESSHDPLERRDKEHENHFIRITGWKPIIIGMVHGLAGSAALTLLVLTNVISGGSSAMGLAYLFIFGIGSIGGMIGMSTLIGLPFVFTARNFEHINRPVRLIAGIASIAFGIYYAWEITRG